MKHREIPGTPYIKMGKPADPPQPRGTAFTDRADGLIWLLSDDAGTHISLVNPPPAFWNGVPFGPFGGPEIASGAGCIRLFVRDGLLGFEVASPNKPCIHGQHRPLSLRGAVTRTIFEIVRATMLLGGGNLVFDGPLALKL